MTTSKWKRAWAVLVSIHPEIDTHHTSNTQIHTQDQGHNQIETNLSSDCQHSPGNRRTSYITCTQTHTHNHNRTEMNLSSVCQRFLKRGGLKVWEDGTGLWFVSFFHCGRERTRRRRGQSWCMPNVKWSRPVKILQHVHFMWNFRSKGAQTLNSNCRHSSIKGSTQKIESECVCLCVCTCVFKCVCESVWTSIRMHPLHMHIYIYICIYTRGCV